jgi:hypothetical protein
MTNLSPDQIQSLVQAALKILQGIMSIGSGTVVGIMREGSAAFSYLKEAEGKFAGNVIIQQMIQGMRAKPADPDAPHEDDDKDAMTLLNEAAGTFGLLGIDEASMNVKRFLLELTAKVAGAAGSGILGTGQKISEQEQDFINQLRGILGV